MSTEIIVSADGTKAVLWNPTTGNAFGPVCESDDAGQMMAAFIAAFPDDPACFPDWQLQGIYDAYVTGINTADQVPTDATSPNGEQAPPPQPADDDQPSRVPATAGVSVAEFTHYQSEEEGRTDEPPPAAPLPDRPAPNPDPAPVVSPRPFDSRDCWNCHGTGVEPGSDPATACGICDGKGWLPGNE